ncbi:MAG TPA: hypothetical protein VGI88_09745 [Verrucomicrobiae bacterium]|jgi:uncharacterized protein (DUF433 family)
MTGTTDNLLNTGIYTVPEAARLTRVSAGRIRRWLRGYKFRTKKKEHHSRAVWHGQLKPIDHSLALGFLDLIEIRFVAAFLKAGVSWGMLRRAHEKGVGMFRTDHPFCTRGFVTDGHTIFVELHKQTGESSLLEIVNDQHVFIGITAPFLKELEFDASHMRLLRWRPSTSRGLVVLDPTRNFGRPIVVRHGVPTEILARAAKAAGSLDDVSRWYEVAKAEIEDAVEFEQQLAA